MLRTVAVLASVPGTVTLYTRRDQLPKKREREVTTEPMRNATRHAHAAATLLHRLTCDQRKAEGSVSTADRKALNMAARTA